MPNESIKANKIDQNDDILICETEKLEDSEEEKEENKSVLNVEEKNNQISSKSEFTILYFFNFILLFNIL